MAQTEKNNELIIAPEKVGYVLSATSLEEVYAMVIQRFNNKLPDRTTVITSMEDVFTVMEMKENWPNVVFFIDRDIPKGNWQMDAFRGIGTKKTKFTIYSEVK